MKAKLVVEGKEFDIEILDKELQKLVASKCRTGYERVKRNENYYSQEDDREHVELESNYDNWNYDEALYYSDKTIARNNARTDRLMRQLRRFSVEHRSEGFSFERYYIGYNLVHRAVEVFEEGGKPPLHGVIYFYMRRDAEAAIEAFRDELTWYFTEYKNSL